MVEEQDEVVVDEPPVLEDEEDEEDDEGLSLIEIQDPMRYREYTSEYEAQKAEEALSDALDTDALWEDIEFPANASSLYQSEMLPFGAMPAELIHWVRLNQKKIRECFEPQLFPLEGINAILQGSIANGWLIGAFRVLATQPEKIKQLFVSESNRSWGLYTIKFYINGEWRYIHLDDRIPCTPAMDYLYAHSRNKNEIWIPLLEKAFAKVFGSYENLNRGSTAAAIRTLTGSPAYSIDLSITSVGYPVRMEKPSVWPQLVKRYKEKSAMGCINTTSKQCIMGILPGTMYGILQVFELGDHRFIKLRDFSRSPESQYKGTWSKESEDWINNPDLQAELKPDDLQPDEFWASWHEFLQCFTTLFVSISIPEGHRSSFSGKWCSTTEASSFGGPPQSSRFVSNPQYYFSVETPTDLVIELIQPDPTLNYPSNTAIGWTLVKVRQDEKRCASVMPEREIVSSRLVFESATSNAVSVDTGAYVLVLYTNKSDTMSKIPLSYQLEIYSSENIKIQFSSSLKDTTHDESANAAVGGASEVVILPESTEISKYDIGAPHYALQSYLVDFSKTIAQLESNN